jgi:hypothetical protein
MSLKGVCDAGLRTVMSMTAPPRCQRPIGELDYQSWMTACEFLASAANAKYGAVPPNTRNWSTMVIAIHDWPTAKLT